MNWKSIESAPIGVRIKLRFKHEIGEYELHEPCQKILGMFFRKIGNGARAIKLQPTEWAPYAA